MPAIKTELLNSPRKIEIVTKPSRMLDITLLLMIAALIFTLGTGLPATYGIVSAQNETEEEELPEFGEAKIIGTVYSGAGSPPGEPEPQPEDRGEPAPSGTELRIAVDGLIVAESQIEGTAGSYAATIEISNESWLGQEVNFIVNDRVSLSYPQSVTIQSGRTQWVNLYANLPEIEMEEDEAETEDQSIDNNEEEGVIDPETGEELPKIPDYVVPVTEGPPLVLTGKVTIDRGKVREGTLITAYWQSSGEEPEKAASTRTDEKGRYRIVIEWQEAAEREPPPAVLSEESTEAESAEAESGEEIESLLEREDRQQRTGAVQGSAVLLTFRIGNFRAGTGILWERGRHIELNLMTEGVELQRIPHLREMIRHQVIETAWLERDGQWYYWKRTAEAGERITDMPPLYAGEWLLVELVQRWYDVHNQVLKPGWIRIAVW